MEGYQNAVLAVERVRCRNVRREGSFQYKFVDWLINNEDSTFTVKMIGKMFDVTQGTVSSSLRNIKEQYGFVFSKVKKSSSCNHGVVYKLIKCRYDFELDSPISPSSYRGDLWSSVLGISKDNSEALPSMGQ